ncbi:MAG: ribulose-phosphate 3-epimerase [Dehalococcoidia bacterium]
MTQRSPGKGPLLAPSILSADFAHLGEAMKLVGEAGAGLIHVDVMDGHFVPNITIGVPVVASLRESTDMVLDVHLMIEEPGRWVDQFVQAGADMISVHAEAERHLHRTVERIRSLGARAGVAINPGTPVSVLDDLLPDLDHVLVMSVNPGFAAQQFLPHSKDKLTALRRAAQERGLDLALEVDGGVKLSNAAELVAAGADYLVAGSAVYGAADPAAAVQEFRAAMARGVAS